MMITMNKYNSIIHGFHYRLHIKKNENASKHEISNCNICKKFTHPKTMICGFEWIQNCRYCTIGTFYPDDDYSYKYNGCKFYNYHIIIIQRKIREYIRKTNKISTKVCLN